MDNNLNENNNNLNGQVLGNVGNTSNVTNNMGDIESLDSNEPINNSQNTNLNMNNIPSQPVNNTPPIPEPSYTNIQAINNSMPGFEGNSIGTTPPISLKPEKKPKKKMKKLVFIILILVLLAGIGVGTWYILKYTDWFNSKRKIEIVPRTIDLEENDKLSLDIQDYATVSGTDIKNCTFDTKNVNTSIPGEYSFIVKCGDISKKGRIIVKGIKKIDIQTKKVYKTKEDTSIEVNEFLETIKDNYTYEFKDKDLVQSYLTKDPGNYEVVILVNDGTNQTEIKANLVILKNKIKGYLVCESQEENVAELNAVKVQKEKLANSDSDTTKNVYGGVAFNEIVYKFNDKKDFTNYLTKYKNGEDVKIENNDGILSFDEENLTITYSKERTNEEVLSKFNINSESTFYNMKQYFKSLNYNCTYVK